MKVHYLYLFIQRLLLETYYILASNNVRLKHNKTCIYVYTSCLVKVNFYEFPLVTLKIETNVFYDVRRSLVRQRTLVRLGKLLTNSI